MVTEVLVEVLLRLRSEIGGSRLGAAEANGAARSGNGLGAMENGNGRSAAGPHRSEPGSTGIAVVGSMEGDRHSLAPQCLRLLLERRGWEVFYLGADVPVEDFSATLILRTARSSEEPGSVSTSTLSK